MSENQLITPHSLDPARIDPTDYANTLAMEALRVGKYTEQDLERIRLDLMNALAEIIGYYTQNESTSVKADTARNLTKSMMYNINTYLLSLVDVNRAAEVLADRKPSELYGKGFLLNTQYFEKAKNLYGKVRLTRLKNASRGYNEVIDKYFYHYLRDYSPKFSAHDKIYLALSEYHISGAFHIDKAIGVLEELLRINRGAEADVIIRQTDPGEAK